MADDDKKNEEVQKAKDTAEEAEKTAEKAESAVEEIKEEVKEVEKEVKEIEKEKKEEAKPSPKVSKKLAELIEQIEKLSVLELSELVKALEAKFGVSAAPVAMTGAASINGQSGDEGVSEQTTFNVILADSGANKISVIKAVREIVQTLGLKEAKDLVDSAPKPVVEGVNKESANEAKTKLEAAGAKVELR